MGKVIKTGFDILISLLKEMEEGELRNIEDSYNPGILK